MSSTEPAPEPDTMVDLSIPGWPRVVTSEHLAADVDHTVPAGSENNCPVCGLAILENKGGNHGVVRWP